MESLSPTITIEPYEAPVSDYIEDGTIIEGDTVKVKVTIAFPVNHDVTFSVETTDGIGVPHE